MRLSPMFPARWIPFNGAINMDIPIEEWQEHDKRKAAIHEAGHATIAALLRIPMSAWLKENPTSDPLEEKTWVGSMSWYQSDLNDLDKATIAVAGRVAEYLADDEELDADSFIQVWEEGEDDGWSPTDLQSIPKSWKRRRCAVERALELLCGGRELFSAIMSELMEKGFAFRDGAESEPDQ
jgi:hypothetical protein